MSAGNREDFQDQMRELYQDPAWQEWLSVIEAKNTKEEKQNESDSESER